MADLKLLKEIVSKKEATLQFDAFSSEMAHEIGLKLMIKAKGAGKPVAIDITRNGHRLFHVALEGRTIEEASLVDSWEFAPHGGSFFSVVPTLCILLYNV